jgi:GMP synthase (glutamine-hydrolysing)
MKIHCLQHVDYESPSAILNWAKKENSKFTSTKFYLNEQLPEILDFDLLIIMGGPMNIYEYEKYPYLLEEKRFIKKAIDQNKSILGICLGGQLIADVLGAKTEKNKEKEIGWFPIQKVKNNYDAELNKILNTDEPVFHWHGDTFNIPQGAVRLAKSEACDNQSFVYKNNIIALQYHLEMDEESLEAIIAKSKGRLVESKFVQSAEEMLSDKKRFEVINNNLYSLLDYIKKNTI